MVSVTELLGLGPMTGSDNNFAILIFKVCGH